MGPGVAPIGFQPAPAPEPRPAAPSAGQALPAPNQLSSEPAARPPSQLPPGPTAGSGTPGQPAGETSAARLTLDQVINAVLITDPRLRSGFEVINQAHASALTASLPPNPTLYTDIQLLPLLEPFTVTQQGGPPQFDLQVSQPIDWYVFGKRAANMAREALGVRAAESDYADLVRRRVLDAATGYYDVAEAEALLDIARQDVINLQRVEAATIKAVDAGTKPRVDLDRVRLDLLTARRTVRDAQTVLVNAKARLRAMIGRTDADPAFDVAPGLDAPPIGDVPPPDEAFALAVKNRPDIEARRRRVAQAGADTEAQWRAAFPPVTPLLGYTRQYQHKAIGFPDQSSWAAALTIGLPFYDRNQGNRAKAASVQSQARYDLAADLAVLRAEVETVAQELRTTRANAEAVAGEQLKLARQVLDSITAAYAAGSRPLTDVLDAERNFRDTYRTYISARAAYWRAVYRFGAVLGQQFGTPPPRSQGSPPDSGRFSCRVAPPTKA
ncbi:MAG: outer rane efflux protein [Gemmataceae bacterium]|nr:outer rane efflux protein [Gemmataceae bacterium]